MEEYQVHERNPEEIIDFYNEVEEVKNKLMENFIQDNGKVDVEKIVEILHKNVNLFNVISDETIKVYIDTFFPKINENENIYKITDETLQTFISSILVFKKN